MNRDDFNISSILGDKLKELRKAKGYTLADVAKLTKFSTQAISLCERAMRMPSPKFLAGLSNIYDITNSELLQIRDKTIIDTIQKYGESSPVSIVNEYMLLINTPGTIMRDSLTLYDGELATEEELQLARTILSSIRLQKNKNEIKQ